MLREGIRRIGDVVAEQVALYETITGDTGEQPVAPIPEEGGDVVPMPRRKRDDGDVR